MEHFYQTIEGWFTFANLYKEMVEKFNSGRFVEVGVWKGQSAAYMAVEILNSKKNIEFYCVDPFNGAAEDGSSYNCKEKQENTLYECFLQNTAAVKELIKPIRDYSVTASTLFANNSVDFVFIDASHDYENVKNDLKAWLPKLKKGGVIAGHDYYATEVRQAVDEFFAERNLPVQNLFIDACWKVDVF